MNKLLSLLLICSALAMVQSCAVKQKQQHPQPQAPETLMRQDPLIGKIVKIAQSREKEKNKDKSSKTDKLINFDTLIKDISSFDVIYLSEKHNNPEHHNIQQKIIKKLIEDKTKPPTIGFEFFSMDDTPDLLNFIDSGKVEHKGKSQKVIEKYMRKKLGWDSQSDEMWKYYYDLLLTAQKAELTVAGIDLPTTIKKRITRKGVDGISPIEKEMIFSTGQSNKNYKDYMYSVFKNVHCGMGNTNMQSRLFDTWTARNNKIALSITQLVKHSKGPVVIIIGGGHTEYGLGVIPLVKALDKNISQVNIALKEISINPSKLSEYLQPLELQGYEPAQPADYICFTQRVSYKDPCKEFEKALEKMKKLNKKSPHKKTNDEKTKDEKTETGTSKIKQ